MKRDSKLRFLIYGVIGLAVIGLLTQLFTNTSSFLANLLMTAIIGLVLFGIFYYFFHKRNQSSDAKKYKQAVRQSKSKYTQYRQSATSTNKTISPNSIKPKNKKRPTHLRVIDGNKPKRNKRASN